jgi:hypothetical protein
MSACYFEYFIVVICFHKHCNQSYKHYGVINTVSLKYPAANAKQQSADDNNNSRASGFWTVSLLNAHRFLLYIAF